MVSELREERRLASDAVCGLRTHLSMHRRESLGWVTRKS